MNSIDFIIKHKLWALAKQTDMHKLEQSIEDYIYDKANFEMLEDVKTDSLLEKYVIRLINNEYEYKHERKMFNYLLENINDKKFTEIINKYSHNYLLLQWTKRNNKNPHFDFLKIIDSNVLTNGTFLNYALGKSDKIVDHAININQSSIYKLTDKIENNLLLSSEIKGKLKIKLLTKFFNIVEKDINEYFINSISNEDEITALWFINNFKVELMKSPNKYYNFLHCTYNALMEKLSDNYFDIVFDRNNQMFLSVFFEKVLNYKKQTNNNIDKVILKDTFNKFNHWKITLNKNDSNSIFYKIVTVENIDFLLESNGVLNIKKDSIGVESLLYKLLENNNKTEITNIQLKSCIEKMYEHEFFYFDRGSNAIFLEYVNKENIEWLFSHKLFNYNVEKLFPGLYNISKNLALDLAKLIDKNIVWKFLETLNKQERVEFELKYYNNKYNEKETIKRLKI